MGQFILVDVIVLDVFEEKKRGLNSMFIPFFQNHHNRKFQDETWD